MNFDKYYQEAILNIPTFYKTVFKKYPNVEKIFKKAVIYKKYTEPNEELNSIMKSLETSIYDVQKLFAYFQFCIHPKDVEFWQSLLWDFSTTGAEGFSFGEDKMKEKINELKRWNNDHMYDSNYYYV